MSYNPYSDAYDTYEYVPVLPHDIQFLNRPGVISHLLDLFPTQHSFVFDYFDSGYTAQLFKFNVDGVEYLLKLFNKPGQHTNQVQLPESDLYLKSISSFVVDSYQIKVFRLLTDYVNITTFMNQFMEKGPCYILDTYRWTVIFNLIITIKKVHQLHVYHRDLHTKNIMIHTRTLHIMLIDLDSACISDKDCGRDVLTRYFYNKYYAHPKNEDRARIDFSNEYAANIDWYSVGIICLEILCFRNMDINTIHSTLVHNYDDIDQTLLSFVDMIYPACSIHQQVYTVFCNQVLKPCLLEHMHTLVQDDTYFYNIGVFYKTHYERSSYFVIQGEAQSLDYYGFVYSRIFEHIMTHAFPNRVLLYQIYKGKPYHKFITQEIVNVGPLSPNLILRGTHYFSGENCKSAYDVNKTTEGQRLIPKKDRCVPNEPYHDERAYNVPYMSLSIEPLRCGLNPYQLPILEINTLVKDKRTIKNTGPYDARLYKKVMWWGNQLFYFDPNAISFWIPYMAHYYCDSIAFNNEFTTDIVIPNLNGVTKTMNFVFMARNCTSELRNQLFTALESKDPFRASDVSMKKVRSYGACMNNSGTHPNDNIASKEYAKSCFHQGARDGGNWGINACVYSESKFVFAIENTLSPGYMTEKIILAFQGGSIPVYYGPPEIKQYFNPHSFYYVNDRLRDPYNPTDAEIMAIADELWALSEDDSSRGWKKYVGQPILLNNRVPDLFLYKTSSWMERLVAHLRTSYTIELERLQTPIDVIDVNLESEGRKRKMSKRHGRFKKVRTKRRSTFKKYVPPNVTACSKKVGTKH